MESNTARPLNSDLLAETSSGTAEALFIFHGECVNCVRQIRNLERARLSNKVYKLNFVAF